MAYSGLADQDSRGWWGNNWSPASYRTATDTIFLHGNAGTNFDAVPGVWRTRPASAHYQVGPDHIRVCLDEENVSWNCGVWSWNCRSIAIEAVNSDANWNFDPKTIENVARLVADICKRRNIPCDRTHIKPHRDVRQTSCPQTMDVDYVIRRANEILGNNYQPSTPNAQPAPQTPPTSVDNRIYFDYRGNVREQPTIYSALMRTYNAGTKMDYAGFVHGQNIDGKDKWLKTALHGWYVWEGITGGTFGLKDLGSVNTGSASQSGRIAQNGTFKANYNMAIRFAPSTSAEKARGTFSAGATHSYDSYIDNEGIRWISFIGDTTKRRVYVARRKLDNSVIWGECY